MSFYLGLAPGFMCVNIDEKGHKGSWHCAKFINIPITGGYLYRKNRFQIKGEASAGFLYEAQNDLLEIGKLPLTGNIRVIAGYRITETWTLSALLGVTMQSAQTKQYRMMNEVNWELSKDVHVTELGNPKPLGKNDSFCLTNPMIGAEVQYQIKPHWYLTGAIQYGFAWPFAHKEYMYVAAEDTMIGQTPVPKSWPYPQENSMSAKKFSIPLSMARITFGFFYRMGDKK